MASIQKRGDAWRALIRMKGITESKTFPRKGEAVAWAASREAELRSGESGAIPNKTLEDLIDRYEREVSVKKAGHLWEVRRFAVFKQDDIVKKRIAVLNQQDFSGWRDRRLATVSPATLLRDWGLMSAILTVAVNEWRWLYRHPMKGIQLPPEPEHRDRLVSAEENTRLSLVAGYHDGKLTTMTVRVYAAFLFAIETGLRAGEIVALQKDDLFVDERFLKVRRGKTQAARRDVPLSSKALAILKQLPMEKSVFDISSSATLDSLFRKLKAKALIEDLHFHDSRHQAITNLSKKLDVLALARAVGHRDLRQLMVYFNETASALAAKLD